MRIILTILLFIPGYVGAQFYTTGTGNPSKKLFEIETGHFKVVYPAGYDDEARKLAGLLEQTYILVKKTMDFELHKKERVLLHTGTVYSNAFVSVAPSRTEINYISPQRSYSENWLEHVVVHEMRHVVQTGKISRGVHQIFKVLLGEGATGILAGQFPIWAYEGDAVVTETAITHAGRGRSPSFLMDLKALTLEGEKFTYEKAYFGSYQDHVPSYYAYGYAMSAFARVEYDSLLWKNMLEFIPKKPYTLYPSYFSLKKYYNISKKDLYNQTIGYFKNDWIKNSGDVKTYTTFNKHGRTEYTDYLYPVVTENGDVICLKKQYSKIDRLIKIDKNGEETELVVPGVNNIERLSYGGGKLVWNEIKQHPRWEKEEGSFIRVFDLQSGNKYTIGKGSKYLVAAINREGTKIAAVETGLPGYDNLVVFDAVNGEIENTIRIQDHIQIPSWHPDENKIIFTKITANGKSIEEIDVTTALSSVIFGPVKYDISSPVYFKNNIMFSSSMNGTDNIYVYDAKKDEISRLTTAKYGAFDPRYDANNNAIFFNEYSSQGYNVCFVKNDRASSVFVSKNDIFEPEIVSGLAKQEKKVFTYDASKSQSFKIKKYNRVNNLFHVHSWMPLYAEPVPEDIIHGGIYPGLTLFSQNLTETMYGWAGYAYKKGYHTGNVNLTYRGLWPVFSVDYEIGGQPQVVVHPDQTNVNEPSETNRQKLSLSCYTPLIFYKGPAIVTMLPRADLMYDDAYNFNETTGIYEKGLTNLQYSATLFIYSKKARKDIYPKWGFYSRTKYYHTPFENNFGDLINTVSRVYLPGFFTNHSLRFSHQFQIQNRGSIRYPYSLNFPRGHNAYQSDRMNMYAADYMLPLFYPDWALGSIAYIKKFAANLFYDQALVEGIFTGKKEQPFIDEFFQSMGIELTVDMHLAHIFVPVTTGARIIYSPQTGKTIFEPIVSFNIGDF